MGDLVRVPMWAFKTVSRGTAAVWGLGVQAGIAAALSLRRQTSEKPDRVILYLSDQNTDLFPENAERCYLGLAIRTRS
jgi:hypothetical protein